MALREGSELCVCDLAGIAGKADSLVGHHLRALRAAGLARSRRDGKIVFYSLTDTALTLLAPTSSTARRAHEQPADRAADCVTGARGTRAAAAISRAEWLKFARRARWLS